MGLDSVAVFPETTKGGRYEIVPDDFFGGISLCGGMMSGGYNSSSFRGKIYDGIVGMDLYKINSPDEVVEIARRLERIVDGIVIEDSSTEVFGKVTWEEVQNLAAWFRIAADFGLAVHPF